MDDQAFITRHRRAACDFTRNRILSFKTLAVFMLTKGTKSLQLRLNTLLPKLGNGQLTADKSAYSRARHKLKHTAFIELNQQAVVRTMYADGDYQTWCGHRVLAIDGSKLCLPETEQTMRAFGTASYRIPQKRLEGTHVFALASVLYDVLNHIAIDARLEPVRTYEVDMAQAHLLHTEESDLVIYDRGYCTFRMMARATQAKGDFLIRCKAKSFTQAGTMLAGKGPDDVVITIRPGKNARKQCREAGLPESLGVRFVRVVLDTGEIEVLVTSLTDQEQHPTACFKELYYLRWGIETFYGLLKTRLNLENFTGLSPEAVRQDFFATIFLTGVEAILTLEATAKLTKQTGGNPKKVNKAVSFNVIKERAFELFYSSQPREQRLQALTALFLTSPNQIRAHRKPPRTENSSRQILNFWKRQRKTVF